MNDSAVLHALQCQVAQLSSENGELRAMVYQGANEALARKLREAERRAEKAERELALVKDQHVLTFGA